MSDARTQLLEFWTGLDATRRRVLVAAGAASLLALGGVGWWASQPSWSTLTRSTDVDTRTAITEKLSVAGVQWRLGEDGQTIEVLSMELGQAKKEAAGNHGLIGLQGVDQLDPWITPFQEQLQKQKMLQEELILQINGIDGIAASRVLLNLKQGTGFLGDDAKASASVSVKSDDGVTLTKDLGKAIARLVSHSVAGMTEADVTVVDQRTGRMLWSGDHAEDPESTLDEAGRRATRMEQTASEALAAVLGSPDHVRVSVTLELDPTSVQSTVNAVDPEQVATLREKAESDQNSSAGAATSASGEAGVQSNTPVAATPTTSAGQARKREQTDTQYQVSTTQTTTVKPAGDVRRVSAAVFVDSAVVTTIAAAAKMDEKEYREALEKAARTALGFDESRGDAVVVSFIPFAEAQMSEATDVASFPWERVLPSAVALVAVVLFFSTVVRPLLRSVTTKAAPASAEPGQDGLPLLAADGTPLPAGEGGVSRGVAAYANHAQAGAEGEHAEGDDNVIDLASRLRKQVEGFKHVSAEDVSALVLRETDHSAEVLRRWIRS